MSRPVTPNYWFTLPEVDGDSAVWPRLLDAAIDAVDAALQSVDLLTQMAAAKAEMARLKVAGATGTVDSTPPSPIDAAALGAAYDLSSSTGAFLRFRVPAGTFQQVNLTDLLEEGDAQGFTIDLSLDANCSIRFNMATGVKAYLVGVGLAAPLNLTFGGKNTDLIRLLAVRPTGDLHTSWFVEPIKFPQSNA